MGGYTGKRAKPPGRCICCGSKIIDPTFMRDKKGDKHESCWMAEKNITLTKNPPSLQERYKYFLANQTAGEVAG